jgi:hypothetical protein
MYTSRLILLGDHVDQMSYPPVARTLIAAGPHHNARVVAHPSDLVAYLSLLSENRLSFFEFSLCLSRACLGKIMHIIYKCLKKRRLSHLCRRVLSSRKDAVGTTYEQTPLSF